MNKATMPKLTRKAVQVRLEDLIYKIGGLRIKVNSIEDGFDTLQLCIVSTVHNLESTQRELRGVIGKQ